MDLRNLNKKITVKVSSHHGFSTSILKIKRIHQAPSKDNRVITGCGFRPTER
ncbi:hypothetical protein SynBIOSE41_01388 [Synechococcus sp. BIOS-E4-1]|nr:hypothetical protein SynBIOSE41_01388 [Synechococcus sp. BIOS-E4-1]